jgi:hypothetical protein
MKFEFHAHLSHLGFDGIYPIYWIKESKQDKNTNILEICMHKAFKIQRRYDLDKTPKEFKKSAKLKKKIWDKASSVGFRLDRLPDR